MSLLGCMYTCRQTAVVELTRGGAFQPPCSAVCTDLRASVFFRVRALFQNLFKSFVASFFSFLLVSLLATFFPSKVSPQFFSTDSRKREAVVLSFLLLLFPSARGSWVFSSPGCRGVPRLRPERSIKRRKEKKKKKRIFSSCFLSFCLGKQLFSFSFFMAHVLEALR